MSETRSNGPSMPAAPPSDASRWWRRPEAPILLTAAALAALAFGGTLRGYFLGDDFAYVGRYFDYPFARWPRLFVREWSEGMWGSPLPEIRPVAALSFMVDARLWGADAFGFRLTNLLLHAACAGFVGLIAWRVSRRDTACGVAAAALFALHPVHAEPVLWITGRVDLLPTLFYLAGFAAFLRYREAGGRGWLAGLWLCYAAAAFSKEFGLTLPAMALAADVLWQRRGREWLRPGTWAPYAGWLAVMGVYYACRRTAFGPGGMGAGLPALGSAEFWTQLCQRQLTYLGHLFPPADVWLREGAPVVANHARLAAGVVAAVALVGCVAWVWLTARPARRTAWAAVFFGAGWYLVATLPLVVTYISARHLYLASVGVCLAWALVLRGLCSRRWIVAVVVAALAGGYAWRLAETRRPWTQAAAVSGAVAKEVVRVAANARPGSALVLDVPELVAGAYTWSWASPFAVKPPFVSKDLDRQLVVIARPAVYYIPEHWPQQPALGRLGAVETDSWLIQAGEALPARLEAVPGARLHAAATQLLINPVGMDAWYRFVKEVKAP